MARTYSRTIARIFNPCPQREEETTQKRKQMKKSMKKIILLLVTLSLLSCSKNEDSIPDTSEKQLTPNAQNMVGIWYYNSIIRANGTTASYVSFCSTKRDYADIISYKKINKHQFFQDCAEGITTCDDYWIDGNRIRSCFDDFNNGRIVSLTATTMKIEYDDVRVFGSIVGDGAKTFILTK